MTKNKAIDVLIASLKVQQGWLESYGTDAVEAREALAVALKRKNEAEAFVADAFMVLGTLGYARREKDGTWAVREESE